MSFFERRRWDLVTPKDFLESYSKYACAYMSAQSPRMRMVLWFAPTVPSPPRPQNLQL